MKDSKNAKSLFLYTALIFVVALLMIILTLFSQNNAERLKETEQRAQTITEKAAQLSDENLYLTQQITAVKEENSKLNETVTELENNVKTLTDKESNTSKVITSYVTLIDGMPEEASALLTDVDVTMLTPETKRIYDMIVAAVTVMQETQAATEQKEAE